MTPGQRGLRDRLAAVPARVARAAAGAALPPAGEWSAREIVLHLVAVEDEVWHSRLAQLDRESNPHWPWTEPGLAAFPGDGSLDTVVPAFASRRADTVARLDALDDVGWSRAGTHATYGRLDVAALLRLALEHDEEHLASLR